MNTQINETAWFEISCLQNEVAGHMKTLERTTHEGIQTLAIAEMRLQRMGQTLTQRLGYETLCDENGNLIRSSYTLPGNVSMEIHVRGTGTDRVAIVTSAESTRSVACPLGTGGCTALQWHLRHPPMRAGEIRVFRSFEFGEDDISETTLRAIGIETVEWPELLSEEKDTEPIPLLRIERTTTGTAIPTQRWTLWCDEAGILRKQATELLGLATYRVDEPTVRRLATQTATLDPLTLVPVHDAAQGAFSAADPQKLTQLQCTVTLDNTEGPLDTFFPQTPCQRIVTNERNRIDFLLVTDAIRQNLPEILETPPGMEDQSPNAWIESNSPEIVAVSQSVAADEQDSWNVAIALERETRRRIPAAGYGSGFESALTALRKGAGDCTEHAVLLAALLRARGIPARVASGLILESNRAVFHAWTEVWLNGRWIGLDATRPQGGIAARYLLVTADHLGGTGAIARLQRVLPVVGNLQLTVTAIECDPHAR